MATSLTALGWAASEVRYDRGLRRGLATLKSTYTVRGVSAGVNASVGTLKYEPEKLIVEVDPGIVALARALLPEPLRSQLRPQRYAPHITVVRNEGPIREPDLTEVTFEYDPSPVIGDTYTWLRVFCPALFDLRVKLGLSRSSEWSRPPDDEEVFHCTIGNRKP